MPTKFQVDISNGAAVIVDMFFAPPLPPEKKTFLCIYDRKRQASPRPTRSWVHRDLPFVTICYHDPPPVSTLNKTPIYRAPRGK